VQPLLAIAVILTTADAPEVVVAEPATSPREHRFEASAVSSTVFCWPAGISIGGGGRFAWFLHDRLAVSARVTGMTPVRGTSVIAPLGTLDSFRTVPLWLAAGDIEWTPLSWRVEPGGSAFLDATLTAGFGALATETGLRPTMELGGGVRLFAREWLAFSVTLLDSVTVDTPAGSTMSMVRHVVSLNAGLAIYFPFEFSAR
jgi:outer membrane beta-barrel protein